MKKSSKYSEDLISVGEIGIATKIAQFQIFRPVAVSSYEGYLFLLPSFWFPLYRLLLISLSCLEMRFSTVGHVLSCYLKVLEKATKLYPTVKVNCMDIPVSRIMLL